MFVFRLLINNLQINVDNEAPPALRSASVGCNVSDCIDYLYLLFMSPINLSQLINQTDECR